MRPSTQCWLRTQLPVGVTVIIIFFILTLITLTWTSGVMGLSTESRCLQSPA